MISADSPMILQRAGLIVAGAAVPARSRGSLAAVPQRAAAARGRAVEHPISDVMTRLSICMSAARDRALPDRRRANEVARARYVRRDGLRIGAGAWAIGDHVRTSLRWQRWRRLLATRSCAVRWRPLWQTACWRMPTRRTIRGLADGIRAATWPCGLGGRGTVRHKRGTFARRSAGLRHRRAHPHHPSAGIDEQSQGDARHRGRLRGGGPGGVCGSLDAQKMRWMFDYTAAVVRPRVVVSIPIISRRGSSSAACRRAAASRRRCWSTRAGTVWTTSCRVAITSSLPTPPRPTPRCWSKSSASGTRWSARQSSAGRSALHPGTARRHGGARKRQPIDPNQVRQILVRSAPDSVVDNSEPPDINIQHTRWP